MSEFELRRHLRELGGERVPRRDLWPDVAARIAATTDGAAVRPRRSLLRPTFAAAAGVALALTIGLVAVSLHHRAGTPLTTASSAAPNPVAASARTGTLSRIAGNDPRLAGTAVVLDAAHAELEQALEQQPDAVFLVGLLNRTNEQRMKLARFAMKAG